MAEYQSENFLYQRVSARIGHPAIVPRQGRETTIGLVHIYQDGDVLHRYQRSTGLCVDSTITKLSDVGLDALCSRIVRHWQIPENREEQVRSELKELQDFERLLEREFRGYRTPVN